MIKPVNQALRLPAPALHGLPRYGCHTRDPQGDVASQSSIGVSGKMKQDRSLSSKLDQDSQQNIDELKELASYDLTIEMSQQSQLTGTYTPEQGMVLETQAATASHKHLLVVADYIVALLSANCVPFAFMGGFSMMIRGSQRDTYDIDVAVGCDMLRLIAVVSAQSRLLRPRGPVSGVMRIYVHTGGSADLSEKYVMVDLILGGSLGVPDQLEAASEDVSINTNDGVRQYRLLNLQSIMQAKLGAIFGRGAQKDIHDILFLIERYAPQIWSFRSQLQQTHRQSFINLLYAGSPERKSAITKAQQVLGVVGLAQN